MIAIDKIAEQLQLQKWIIQLFRTRTWTRTRTRTRLSYLFEIIQLCNKCTFIWNSNNLHTNSLFESKSNYKTLYFISAPADSCNWGIIEMTFFLINFTDKCCLTHAQLIFYLRLWNFATTYYLFTNKQHKTRIDTPHTNLPTDLSQLPQGFSGDFKFLETFFHKSLNLRKGKPILDL